MADYDVNDVASVGYIGDIPGFQLPPEAWTFAENARMVNDGAGSGATWAQLFSTGSVSPWLIQPVAVTPTATWLTYADLNNLYAWDQTNIATVSGPSAPYGSLSGSDWVSTLLSGAPVFTNNKVPPQYWTQLSLGAHFADMPYWVRDLGTGAVCKSIRAFGPFLVALHVTFGSGGAAGQSASYHPHGVLWSHPADPGTMPLSWNIADPTMDAGFTELNDADAGVIIDGLPLRTVFIIYKENSTWTMRLVGGQYIMQLDPLLLQSGLLAAHCAAVTGDGKFHFCATSDDIIIHDGSTATSLLDKRARRTLFNRISTTNYAMCHVFSVPTQREMWFCYPETGASQVTRALIWNYSGGGNGVLYESVFPYPCGAVTDIPATSSSWDSRLNAWTANMATWEEAARRHTIIADPNGNQILLLDSTNNRAGVPFITTLQREALSFIAHRRLPMWDPLIDFKQRKYVRRIWPKLRGAPCNIRIGFTDTVAGATDWGPYVSFNPATQVYADFTVSGRETPSVEFTWNSSVGPGTLYGYKMEIFPAGNF